MNTTCAFKVICNMCRIVKFELSDGHVPGRVCYALYQFIVKKTDVPSPSLFNGRHYFTFLYFYTFHCLKWLSRCSAEVLSSVQC